MTWGDAFGIAFITTFLMVVVAGIITILFAIAMIQPYLAYGMMGFVVVWLCLAVCFKKGWLK